MNPKVKGDPRVSKEDQPLESKGRGRSKSKEDQPIESKGKGRSKSKEDNFLILKGLPDPRIQRVLINKDNDSPLNYSNHQYIIRIKPHLCLIRTPGYKFVNLLRVL